ncbi:MAG: hypothetical protein M1834_003970 [Cirrosporium novae-zelandiae]|nr:MAG: hypothetical protein M1834_003970 [Cirrosporium novae-zelandiae]
MLMHIPLRFVPRIELQPQTFFLLVVILCLGPLLAVILSELNSYSKKQTEPKGCRKIGLRIRSNLADQYEKKYAGGGGDRSYTVKSLWIYPLKSCRGIELNRGEVVSTGMLYDRQFSFAQLQEPAGNAVKDGNKSPSWKFLSMRQYPLFARVKVELWVPDPSSPTYSPKAPEVKSGGVLVVSFPCPRTGWKGFISKVAMSLGGSEPEKTFRVPFAPSLEQIKENRYTTEAMTIWKDTVPALNMATHVPSGLKEFLGVKNPLTLFRINDQRRQVFRCAPRKEEVGYQPIIGFADAYPLHIMNLASLHDVASKLRQPIKLNALRFRPNIIMTGPAKFEEDSWKKIKIGDFIYYCACRTVRCRLPNVDPFTGIKNDVDPDKTLKSYRCIDQGDPKNACFGMQMVPAIQESQIKVGDQIEVLETGEHFYQRQ